MRQVERAKGYRGIAIIAAVIPALLLIRGWFHLDFSFQSETVLATLQVISAIAACAAGLMASAVSVFSMSKQDNYLTAIAAALIIMGIISGALAVRTVNSDYLVLAAGAQLFGGMFVCTAWLGDRVKKALGSWRLPVIAVAASAVLLMVVTKRPHGSVPGFLGAHGRYGSTYLWLANLAAVFFVLAAGYFLRAFRRRARLSDLVFCCFALVSGLTDIAWQGLFVWGPLWWICQILQTGAYGVILVYLLCLHLFLERSLEESENRFETLSNAAFEGILVLKDSRATDWNAAFARISGFSRNALRGLPLTALLPAEAFEALMHGASSVETELRGDERLVPVEVRKQLAGDTCFVIFRDLSERRNLEREVASTQARLNELFDHSTDGVAYAELDGKVLQANRAFSTLTGYSPEALALGVAAVDVLRSGGRAFTPAAIGYGREYERDYLKHDGTRIHVVQTEFPVRNVDGRVTHVGILVKDVTESRQSTETLRRLNEELTRSNRELDRFAAIASHDLAEPLRTIATSLQLLERKESNVLQADSRKYLQFALAASRRLRGMIQGFLAYSRVQSRARAFVPVDCSAAATRVLESVRTLLEETGARVQCEDLPSVHADPELVELLLQNLIVNAVKYRRDVPPEVRVFSKPCAEGWTLAVADNGCGIGKEAQDKIFTLFARGPQQDSVPGDGIGLATCKKIVELFGGRIWVESTPAVGSTFWFTLPRSEDAPGAGKGSRRPDNLVS